MRELLILGSKISRFYAAILKKVRHFIHRNDNIAPYSFQLFAKTIQEVVVAQFSDFTKFKILGFWDLLIAAKCHFSYEHSRSQRHVFNQLGPLFCDSML